MENGDEDKSAASSDATGNVENEDTQAAASDSDLSRDKNALGVKRAKGSSQGTKLPPGKKRGNKVKLKNVHPLVPGGVEQLNSIPLGVAERKPKDYNISLRGRERIQNDYNQHFIDTGERPQNFIRDAQEEKRFQDYPKLQRLLLLKNEIIKARATPARCIKADLRNFDWDSLQVLFDVVLINPPWQRNIGSLGGKFGWSGQDIIDYLPIDKIVEPKSFCFIWCDVYTMEDAKYALKHWGYRRCEDICWLKTNAKWTPADGNAFSRNRLMDYDAIQPPAVLHRTCEHCLMGLRGLIRRNEEGYLVHSNLDTDVIIAEELDPRLVHQTRLNFKPSDDPEQRLLDIDQHIITTNPKPSEIYNIIDRFCLGRRKLEIFGSEANVRDGWLTLSPAVSETNYDAEEYKGWTEGDASWPQVQDYKGGRLMGSSEEIELLRPKSPPKNEQGNNA